MVDAVRTTGRAARFDTDDPAGARVPEGVRAAGLRSAVAHPIVVEGGVWGAIAVGSGESPMPAVTEGRLAGFTELVATAVANTDAREQVTALAEEQAALRRVATLVAEGAEPAAVFEAVAAETQTLIGADGVSLSRYEPAEHVLVVAHTGANAARVPPGTRVNHEGHNMTSIVRRTERPARLEQFTELDGAIGELAKDFGVRASVGVPIIVDGRLWGVTVATWLGDASPPPGHRSADESVRRAAGHGHCQRRQPRPADGVAGASGYSGGRGPPPRGARSARRRAAAARARDRDAQARSAGVPETRTARPSRCWARR